MSGLAPDLTRLLASLGEGVWQRDLNSGEAWYSARYKALLGFADDELANDAAGFAERVHPEDRAAVEQVRQAALSTLAPCSGEARMRTRSGEWRWFRATVRVWPDAVGRPEMLMGSVADVHVEKCALLEVKALAERFERAMAASSEANFERTAGVDDFFMSPRLPALLGYPPGTPGPSVETYMSWVHPDDVPGLVAARQRAAAEPGSWEFDYRLRHVDGSYRWFGGRGRSEWDDQGRLRMTGMVGDIHAHKLAQQELLQHRERLERMVLERTASLTEALALADAQRAAAERANLAKATFLAHMSHELRTPLNGVMGMTQLAMRIASSDTQLKYLGLAEKSGQTLLRILNDVLDFAKADAGKLRLVNETFDLPQLVAETVRSLLPLVGQRPLHVMFDSSGAFTQVCGDAGRVRQIVSNLVDNALKFTDKGSIFVVVEVAALVAGRSNVRIEVRDSGIGMDDITQARVFAAFEQADSSITRRHGGAGLGLPIVRLLARMMGGDVQVRSAPGEGSTFTVDLQLATAPDAEPPEPKADGTAGHAWLLFRSEQPAQWVRRRLARLGWTADVLDGIPAAIKRLRDDVSGQRPDCVVVSDEALTAANALAPLRQALPPRVPLSLLFRPDFHLPALHEAAAAAGVHLAIAPLTEADLRQLVRPPAMLPVGLAPAAPTAPLPLVLVVDDVEMNRTVVGGMLRALGLRVGTAASGAEAIGMCNAAAPDLVLMDIEMPGMDGLVTSRKLRSLQASSQLPSFPILALTVKALDNDRQASFNAGINEHLSKPIDLERLRKVLARWLPEAQLTQ